MFQPVVPFGGLAGWRFLQASLPTQQAAHENSGPIQRDVAYFRDNISKITSAEALVSDRRMLSVALGAFGLDGDINNTYFVRTVLEQSTLDTEALANRIADKSYLKMAQAFGFGDFSVPNTKLSDFADKITTAYTTRQFEISIGQSDENLRLALNLQRELVEIADDDISDDAKWFTVMGNEPLRRVFETGLGLPSAIASIDIDKQLEVFRDKAAAQFGSGEIAQFSDAGAREDLVRLFLLRAQVASAPAALSGANTALTLLQNT